jgi:hypothetical protein
MIRKHVVVDGSNIATEARSSPSLRQLDEAVRAFLTEHPTEHVTVVVDATFGHRIDESERAEYEAAVNAGEIITAPAGTIGRGDAFVLQVADKAGATILSNDSFQEFHGQFPWLFEEGRLVGGKPVPPVGWVFLLRSPVRGAISRRAVKETNARTTGSAAKKAAKRSTKKSAKGSKKASAKKARTKKARLTSAKDRSAETTTDRERSTRSGRSSRNDKTDAPPGARDTTSIAPGRRRPGEPLNDPLPFIEFVGAHPVGSIVDASVERFSSHGAFVLASGAQCYVPLKSMGDPPPRSAKDVLRLGETRAFVVDSFDVPRRGIDLALLRDSAERAQDMGVFRSGDESVNDRRKRQTSNARSRKSRSSRVSRVESSPPELEDRDGAFEEETAKTHTKASGLATTTRADQSAEEAPVTPAKRASAKKAGRKSAAKRGSKKATAKRTTKKKATAKRRSSAKRPAKKRSAKKRSTKKAAKKRPAKKRSAKKRSTKKAAKKRPAKKRSAKKRSTKKAAKKRPAKKRSRRRR